MEVLNQNWSEIGVNTHDNIDFCYYLVRNRTVWDINFIIETLVEIIFQN